VMTADAPSTSVPAAAIELGAADTGSAAEDLRLARLHLRLGMVTAARAELEDLARRHALDLAGLAAVAEARWRGGDLEAAADAADAPLRAGGHELLAIVVAAEAAAAAGRPTEARELVDRAGRLDAAAIDALFGGLPRRAYWPAAGGPAAGGPVAGVAPAGAPPAIPAGQASPRVPGPAAATSRSGSATPAPLGGSVGTGSAIPGPGDVLAANAGLWDAELPAGVPGSPPPGPRPARPASSPAWVEPAREKGHADPELELETARDELAAAPDRGLLRLALVLRLDPTLAPDVLEAVRLRREPAALVIRGDAQRLLGRHLEAEADFADAAEAIERDAIAHARRGGHHASREDS
ncbi:MAG TPA: hypothetical protein VET90_02230, partial [Candidatus Binatus sp.]|nr:hypothetical protein [Candidatus Binatus sp.]